MTMCLVKKTDKTPSLESKIEGILGSFVVIGGQRDWECILEVCIWCDQNLDEKAEIYKGGEELPYFRT